MLKLSLLCILLFLGGCATKYLVPTNRFMTPETQGGILNGRVELQKTAAHEMRVNGRAGSVDDGVLYNTIDRVGYQLSTSFFEAFDLVWNHVGNANSMVGGKFQFLGTSRSAKGADHKMAFAALFGSNEHETQDKSVEFTLSGKEFYLIYGYRFTENIMPYASLAHSIYSFDGKIKTGALSGLEPSYETKIISLNGGAEFSLETLFLKAEYSYQRINTANTPDKTATTLGFALGLNW